MKRLLLLAVALSACGPQQATVDGAHDSKASSGAALQSKVLLTFPPNFAPVQQSQPITAGATVHVNYDVSRLSQCRGDFNGQPGWTITAFWQLDQDPVQSFDAGGFGFGNPVNGNEFVVSHAGQLSLWFEITDRWGCNGWDSAYGNNYRFGVASAPPVIHFKSDWSSSVEGTLAGAAVIAVDYDPARLPQCRGQYMGWQTWSVTANWNFSGGTGHSAPVTAFDNQNVVTTPALISVDPGATQLQLWFHGSDETDCSSWDSDFGRNYVFSLQ